MLGLGTLKGLLAPVASKSQVASSEARQHSTHDKALSSQKAHGDWNSRAGAPTERPALRVAPANLPAQKPAARAKPDLYPVSAEIVRPGKQGYHLSVIELKLSAALLNTIYEAAYQATAAVPGDIVSVSLHVAAPGAQPVLQVVRAVTGATQPIGKQLNADGASDGVAARFGNGRRADPVGVAQTPQRSSSALQPTLISAEDDDSGDEDDHECDFREGFCWICGQPDPDAFEADSTNVIDCIAQELTSLKLHNQSGRFELALEIVERAEAEGIDLDEPEAVWDWWQATLGYIYARIVNTSHNPRNVPDTLAMAEQILLLGRKRGQNTPERAWEYFNLYGTVVYTLQGERRKPQVILEGGNARSSEGTRGGRHGKRGKR